MKTPMIAVVAPYENMKREAEEIIAELNLDAYVLEGDLAEGVKAARKAVKNGAEAIVSRSGTALMISRSVEVPVIEVEISAFDVVRCLPEIRDTTVPIGVVGFQKLVYGCSNLGKVLHVDLREIVISRADEMPQRIAAASSEGIKVIMGGTSAVSLAAGHGLRGVILSSGKEALAKAIYDAVRIAEVRLREKEHSELIKVLVNSSKEGIVAIDRQDKITLFNPVAAQLYGIKAQDVIGARIQDKIPGSQLSGIISNHPFEPEALQKLRDKVIVINRFPIKVNNEIIGAFESLRDVTEIQRLEQLARQRLHAKGLIARANFADIIGSSPEIIASKKKAKKYAGTELSILIMGESGTGKEILAQGIHNEGPRRNGPFVAVNCAALPESLLESELFGYEEGAFTGARRGGKLGLFELAHGGTLFLDEIGEMPLPLQSRLLRVLQERSVLRIGGNSIIPVDVRIITSTNRNIHSLIEAGQFRQDLYYRINTLTLLMPSLREREGDIPVLTNFFLKKHASINPEVQSITQQALHLLECYPWPGNIRELGHAVERLLILTEAKTIEVSTVKALLEDLRVDREWGQPESSDDYDLKQMEEKYIAKVLEEENGNKTRAAQRLGMSRATLWRKLYKHHDD